MIKKIVRKYLERKRDREIEKCIAESMYSAAALSSYMSFEEMIKTIADSGYGALSHEFRVAYNDIMTGESVERALQAIIRRSSSSVLKRAVNILAAGYVTGMDLSAALREAAEDVEKMMEMARENNAAMAVEKYTLLFAGGMMVPLILGSMISFVGGVDISSLEALGITENSELLAAAGTGNQIYVVIYSVMASLFVAYREGMLENSAAYLAFLLPSSVLLFNLAQAGLFL